MKINDHQIFDKRQKKPKVYRIKNINQDVTMQQIETYSIGKSEVRFNTPNITAVFLSVSEKEFEKAKAIYATLIKPKEGVGKRFELNEIETAELYNYLEHIQTVIITLYSAIESLANILIPDGHEFEQITAKGIKEIWNKKSIEKWKQTREKLKDVIPKAWGISSPANYKCWTKFLQFEELRNDIIHVKSTSLTNKENDKKIIGILLSDSVFTKIKAANELIVELSEAVPYNHDYPILKNSEHLIPIEIESFEDLGLVKVD